VRLATIRTGGRTAAVRIEGDVALDVGAPDVGALLADPGWPAVAADGGREHDAGELDYAPLVPSPGKIVCVGLNYRDHIAEMGHDTPAYPTLFAKFAGALVGAGDDIVLPAAADAVDWEAELAVVIGRTVRHATVDEARRAVAGYSILNDVTARDWQNRTSQWLQGKTFEATTPLGPHLVTPDDPAFAATMDVSCRVNGQVMQHGRTDQLVFSPTELVAYISTVVTLRPGDVIATGTPAGVGHGRTPPVYLADGDRVVTAITGLGQCDNRCRAEKRR